jgi:hypothetical protein
VRQSIAGAWIGASGTPPTSGAVSVVALASEPLAASACAAVVVDDWSEAVPTDRQLTGVAFHHDSPGAEAPQVVLLMVPSAPGLGFDTETIERGFADLFDLIRLRVASWENHGALMNVLPSLYLPSQTPRQ